MNRLARSARVLALLAISVAGILGLLLVLLAVLVPDTVTDFRIGSQALGTTVRNQAGTLIQSAKLNPLVDVAILAGAYVFVCLLSWSQDQIANYLTNRRHYS
jgi:hypothetical protein